MLIRSLALFILVVQVNYAQQLTSFVNPFIGTSKMGHTFPGATVPFGMVQLSPDTDTIPYAVDGKYNPKVYSYCAGFQYNDPTIVGFSHTHFSGTGHSDLGDILIAPTSGKLQLNPGTADNPKNGFRSAYKHSTESAHPNYYSVLLEDHGIKAELTTSERVGMHRYTFSRQDSAHIILDLVSAIYNYEGKNVWTYVKIVNDTLITGYRQTNGWARNRTVYFAISFSKAFKNYGYQTTKSAQVYRGFWRKFNLKENFPEMAANELRAYFDFDLDASRELELKVALSSVSMEGALTNMKAEIPDWDFDKVRKKGEQAWEKELSKITVETMNPDDKVNFYTALYHSALSPTIYQDVDGRYRGLDQEIHTSKTTNYTTFSLWDTYRALHPLLNLIQPTRNGEMVQSMINHFQQSPQHLLPVWSHFANENWCMIGYHSVPVIADAILNDNHNFSWEDALTACVETARNRAYDGLDSYIDLGYVAEDKSGSSASKTLEYAFDDWCIAQIARKMKKDSIYAEFMSRSESYHRLFDPSSGFMRARLANGQFISNFDVLDTHQAGYIEGNAWNYSLYVPHQPDSLIRLMGGNDRFVAHLDSLFTMELPDSFFEHTEDITREGIIGNYVHGNEPSHHVAYLFNWTNQAWKTQFYVRQILTTKYIAKIEGLSGNDDCGQMSAWYVFSALGFYPVAPGSSQFEIGSPLVKAAKLTFENGKTLEIKVSNQSAKNCYVQAIKINGSTLQEHYFTYKQLTDGGTIEFIMGSKPKKKKN